VKLLKKDALIKFLNLIYKSCSKVLSYFEKLDSLRAIEIKKRPLILISQLNLYKKCSEVMGYFVKLWKPKKDALTKFLIFLFIVLSYNGSLPGTLDPGISVRLGAEQQKFSENC
jgi:hypothetical protein